VQIEEDVAHAETVRLDEEQRLRHFTSLRDTGFDLMSVDTTAPFLWVPGAKRIIKQGEKQSWVAREGEGKTHAAMHLVAQVCSAVPTPGLVVYIDVENDGREMAERLLPILDSWGARDTVAENLVYLSNPNVVAMLTDDALAEDFVGALAVCNLVVIDSWTRILEQFSLEENQNSDIADFVTKIVDPLAAHGVAVLILDNMGKNGEEARGAVNKRALMESVYNVTGGKGVKPPDPDDPDDTGKHGELELKLDRSRSGKLADWVKAGSGGGEWEPLTPQKGDAPRTRKESQEARRDALRQRFADFPGTAYGKQELKVLTNASEGSISADLKVLATEGYIEKAENPNTKEQLWMRTS
jgi:hypothetical protein